MNFMAHTSVISESAKMKLEVDTEGDAITFRPSGTLDEDVNFSIVLESINKMSAVLKSIRFDLGHVRRMNSCGVREWILLMERMPAAFPLTFLNVNELMVEQATMLPGIFGKRGAQVLSFHVPYHCASCNSDVSVVIEPKDVRRDDGSPHAPEKKCSKCGGNLDFDGIEEEYFDFLNFV